MIDRKFLVTLLLFVLAYWVIGYIFKELEYSAAETMDLEELQHFFEEYPIAENPRVKKFGLVQHGHRSSYLRFLTLLSDPLSGIHKEFFHILEKSLPGGTAYFWECLPVTMRTIESTNFEFVIISSDELSRISADFGPFQKKFSLSDGRKVMSFPNLGRDSVLVTPTCVECPQNTPPFAHIAEFMHHATFELKMEFWIMVATETLRVLAEGGPNRPLWLSTSGLGVSWLHVRLDTIPKYYNWVPYKTVSS